MRDIELIITERKTIKATTLAGSLIHNYDNPTLYGRRGGQTISAQEPRSIWARAVAGDLLYVFGLETLLSRCSSLPRGINGYFFLCPTLVSLLVLSSFTFNLQS